MRKKVLGICLIACLVFASAISAYAAVPDTMEPLAQYYFSVSASLTISSSGLAKPSGSIMGIAGTTTKTTVHLYLQRYEDGDWVDVDDWLVSNNSATTSAAGSKQVEKGYKYRAKASCYAYCGSDYERVIRYSSEIYY